MTKYKLLSIGADAKTTKGEKFGTRTGILYLAPATLSSEKAAALGITPVNVCPTAHLAGCDNGDCLYFAGHGRWDTVQNARIRRTLEMLADFNTFMNNIAADIARLVLESRLDGMQPVVRLNGTSDIAWESRGFTLNALVAAAIGVPAGEYPNIFSVFPAVQFYDYTKVAGRFNRNLPDNYDLTFSYSAAPEYKKQVAYALSRGARMAVVFRTKKFPKEFMGMRVIDGDEHDMRFTEPQGVVVALAAKGTAKKSDGPLVVDMK